MIYERILAHMHVKCICLHTYPCTDACTHTHAYSFKQSDCNFASTRYAHLMLIERASNSSQLCVTIQNIWRGLVQMKKKNHHYDVVSLYHKV